MGQSSGVLLKEVAVFRRYPFTEVFLCTLDSTNGINQRKSYNY